MGLFKKIGNALGIKNHTFVGQILGTDHSNDNNGGGGSSTSKGKNIGKLLPMQKIGNLNATQVGYALLNDDVLIKGNEQLRRALAPSANKSFFGNLWGNVKDSFGNGVSNMFGGLGESLAGAVLGSDWVKKNRENLTDQTSEIMDGTISKWFKKNLFTLILIIGGGFALYKFVLNPKKKRSKWAR